MSFIAGQKVRCIDRIGVLDTSSTYTIKNFFIDADKEWVTLFEITNTEHRSGGWLGSRFISISNLLDTPDFILKIKDYDDIVINAAHSDSVAIKKLVEKINIVYERLTEDAYPKTGHKDIDSEITDAIKERLYKKKQEYTLALGDIFYKIMLGANK